MTLTGGSTRMSKTGDARELVELAMSASPRGVMSDIDGTISRIAEHPDSATVEPAARDALDRLARRVDLVAAVSGRAARDALAMVGSQELVYAGNHGMEVWRAGLLQQSRRASTHAPRVDELIRRLRDDVTIDGVYFENKDLTASIHVRGTADPDEAERTVLVAAERLANELDLRVTRGRMVIEIRPPVDISKGTAVVELVEDYQLRGLVFFGDDMTDVDAFHSLRTLRQETGAHLYSIGVTREQTPPEIRESADALVSDVDGVVEALQYAADLVERPDSGKTTGG